jgi:class 3 adenylate cyclase
LAAHACFWLLPNVFEPWNAQTVDQLFVLRDTMPFLQPAYDDTVVHVDFNNSSSQRLNTISMSRAQHAQVIRNLAAMRVAAQVHDYIVASRTNAADDQALIEATAAAGQVYYGVSLTLEKTPAPRQLSPRTEELQYLEQTAWQVSVHGDTQMLYRGTKPLVTFAPLARAARGLGFLNIASDRDGVLRRMPLLVRYGEAWYPSLALRVACEYLRVPPENIIVEPGRRLVLRHAQRPGVAESRHIVIPIDRRGNMVINYLGTWERLKHYNLADVLLASGDRDELELWRAELAGKIVVVADVATGSSDVGAIPLDTNFPLSGLHSNIIHSILTARFLRQLSLPEMLGLEALLGGLMLLLTWRIRSYWLTLGMFLLAVGYVGVIGVTFLYGQVIGNLVRPLLMLTFATIALMVQRYIAEERAKLEGLRQRDFVRQVFGRYLSDAVVDEILSSPRGMDMGGELRQLTILVSDLRGFTSLAARLSPPEVIAVLNRYLERMIDVIARYHGTVDEIMGDGMLVFFGVPLAASDDPERAVACAIEMQQALEQLNAEHRAIPLPELAMGIGINTGEVVVGNIGSTKRSKYGAVGDAINTTYRIESHTIAGQILMSPSTYERVRSIVHVRGTLPAQFKGLAQVITLYDISGIGGPYHLALPEQAAETYTPITPPVPLVCFPIEGKIVSSSAMPGCLTGLAGATATAMLQGQVAIYSNVKLVLTPSDGPEFPEVYAKVLEIEPQATGTLHVRLAFTALPAEATAFLAARGQR